MRREGRVPKGLVLLLPALALSACAGGYDPYDRNQRALTGTAVGAGAGALIGSLSGNAGRGALIGGALGTVLGALTPPPSAPQPVHGGYYQQPARGFYQAPAPAYAAPQPGYGYGQRGASSFAYQQPSGWYDQSGQYHQGTPPFGMQ